LCTNDVLHLDRSTVIIRLPGASLVLSKLNFNG